MILMTFNRLMSYKRTYWPISELYLFNSERRKVAFIYFFSRNPLLWQQIQITLKVKEIGLDFLYFLKGIFLNVVCCCCCSFLFVVEHYVPVALTFIKSRIKMSLPNSVAFFFVFLYFISEQWARHGVLVYYQQHTCHYFQYNISRKD